MSILTKDNFAILLLLISFILILTSFIITTKVVGEKDEYSALRGEMTTIIVVNSVAIVALFIGILMFFSRYTQYAHIYNLVISAIAMFMGLTALSVSVISKVY
jgi:hypothetical protein